MSGPWPPDDDDPRYSRWMGDPYPGYEPLQVNSYYTADGVEWRSHGSWDTPVELWNSDITESYTMTKGEWFETITYLNGDEMMYYYGGIDNIDVIRQLASRGQFFMGDRDNDMVSSQDWADFREAYEEIHG